MAAHGHGETTCYVYNSSGERVRKVTERASGSRLHERIYAVGSVGLRRGGGECSKDRCEMALIRKSDLFELPH